MKKLLKNILCLSLMFFVASFAFSVNFGANLNSTFGIFDSNVFPSKESNMLLSEKVDLWMVNSFNENVLLRVQGSYELGCDFETIYNQLDLSCLKLEMGFDISRDSTINVDFGRFYVSDSDSTVYGNLIDGVNASLSLDDVEVDLFCGYTGLLNANSISIVNSSKEKDSNKIYSLASGFLVAGNSLVANDIWQNNSISYDVFAFLPMEKAENRSTSIYGKASFFGNINTAFYHDFSAILGLFYGEKTTTGFVLNGNFGWYPSFKNSTLGLNVLYASENYYPFIDSGIVMGEDISLNGLLKIGINGSIKPLSNLYIGIMGDFVMDSKENKIAPDCFQWSSSLSWQIFSDMMFNINLIQKIPLNESVIPGFMGVASLVVNI